ncbi:hypothetical protein CBOM_00783 [Ceraceosorus bombacis]|uniref:Uncharacterized protein n=1 Tax=Ceraceosorus bombacis TaxID=401625 RepID=A0A0P1BBH0_9BASI|nr:hypothetical protein CBOM_00783 [Ceraceosorus bombacis]
MVAIDRAKLAAVAAAADAKEDGPTNACGPLAFNFWQETLPDQDNYGAEPVAALAEEGQRQRSAVDCDRGTAGTGPENQVLALGGVGFYGTDGSKSIRILGRAASLDPELNTVHYIKPQETLYELPYPTSRSTCSTSDTLFPSPAPSEW